MNFYTKALDELNNTDRENKIRVLVKYFRDWHTDAPIEELTSEDIYGFMGAICRVVDNQYGLVLRKIFDTIPYTISGSHLKYIKGALKDKMIENHKNKVKKSIENLDPDRYIKGRFGHMVQR